MAISGLTGRGSVFNTPSSSQSNPFSSGGQYSNNPQSSRGGSSGGGRSGGGGGGSSGGGSVAPAEVTINGLESYTEC